MLSVGSCFSGIGGIELGLEATGWFKTKWQIEIDPYASAVLARHWPDIPRFTDIETVDAKSLEPVDLICGGFPCQDISDAGKRAGISGERSGLWRELLRTICVVRPRFVLVENVAALLKRGMGTVLGDLAKSGYDAEWDCIPASAVGAPHIRSRVFILADTTRSGREQGDKDTRGASQGKGAPREWGRPTHSDWWKTEPPVYRMDDGVPNRSHRLKCLGNAVVPQVAQKVGEIILEAIQ